MPLYVGNKFLRRTPFASEFGEIDFETGKSELQLFDDDPFVVEVILKFLHGLRFPDGSNDYDAELHMLCGSLEDLARVYVTLDRYDIPGLKENLLGFLEDIGESFFDSPEDFLNLAKALNMITGVCSAKDDFSRHLIDLVKEASLVKLDAEMKKPHADLFEQITYQSIEQGFAVKGTPSPEGPLMVSRSTWPPCRLWLPSVWTYRTGT